jgi:hypothetical protein
VNKEQIESVLEAIYLNFYDGLYTEEQLKYTLKKLYLKANVTVNEWSELILDTQWKYATEEDYEKKRRELEKWGEGES